jgi:hypothetical protein
MHRKRARSSAALSLPVLLAVGALGCGAETADSGRDAVTEPGASATFSELKLRCELGANEHAPDRVDIAIRNDGPHEVALMSRGTPWDRASSPWIVERAAERQRYLGVTAFRNALADDEYLPLDRGGELAMSYPLAVSYGLASVEQTRVKPSRPLWSMRVDGELLAVQHDCGELSASFGSAHTSPGSDLQVTRAPLIYETGQFACTASEQAEIEAAEKHARIAALTAERFMGSNKSIFRRWFGQTSEQDLFYVATQIGSMLNSWRAFRGDCDNIRPIPLAGCFGGTAAWVTALEDYEVIHICSLMLEQTPLTVYQPGAQIGTLIHEKVHVVTFGEVTDQSDSVCTDRGDLECYGPSDARALALVDPGKATKSAENYGLFVTDVYLNAVVLPAALVPFGG